MGVYKELDPAVALKLIEGFKDELTGEAAGLAAFYRQFVCPAGCGNTMQKELDPKHAFADPDTLTPRSLLRCMDCQLLMDPHSGLVLQAGNRMGLPG